MKKKPSTKNKSFNSISFGSKTVKKNNLNRNMTFGKSKLSPLKV